MKSTFSLMLVCGLTLTGFGPKDLPAESETVSLSLFKAGKGVCFSEETKNLFGIWPVELSALKGGTPCCPVPKKTAAK